jgi:phospholipid/cholesterol/gamma-HCH transport system ATP-binding protein
MATPGMPERKAVGRRQARVREIMHTLPPAAQEAIRDSLDGTDNRDRNGNGHGNGNYAADDTTTRHRTDEEAPTASIPVQREA